MCVCVMCLVCCECMMSVCVSLGGGCGSVLCVCACEFNECDSGDDRTISQKKDNCVTP